MHAGDMHPGPTPERGQQERQSRKRYNSRLGVSGIYRQMIYIHRRSATKEGRTAGDREHTLQFKFQYRDGVDQNYVAGMFKYAIRDSRNKTKTQ